MGSKLSPWYKSERNRQGKTTPKYDPDRDQGKPKYRGLYKPTRAEVKLLGSRSVEDRKYVWRYRVYQGYGKHKEYVVREKMTQEQYDEYVVQRWREVNGRGGQSGTVTGRVSNVQEFVKHTVGVDLADWQKDMLDAITEERKP